MRRRYTDTEVALARRIKAKMDVEREAKLEQLRNESWADMVKRIMDAPIHPTGGPTPPWWEQAIAETDYDQIWIEGHGWMSQSLWDDIVACSEEVKNES